MERPTVRYSAPHPLVGVYQRKDSPFFWMLCERPGQKPLVRSTKVPIAARSVAARNEQRRAAEDVYRAQMTDLARQRHDLPLADPTVTTFAKYAAWWTEHQLPRRRRSERDALALKHLRAWFDRVDLTVITRATVQEYITHRLAAKKKASTVNREVDVLKIMLRDAIPAYLKASPLAGMKKLRTVPPPKRVLTPAEETRLLAQLPARDRVFYIVAVDTLVRLQNVIDLRWSEVKAQHLELADSKTGPYRVPLSVRAKQALGSLPREGVYCFPHRHTAKNMRDVRNAVGRLLKRACARCVPPIPYGRGIGVTFHTATRATGATRMLRAGVDPRTVQAVGNWKDFRAMQEYLQPDSAHLRAAVNTIAPRKRHVIGFGKKRGSAGTRAHRRAMTV